MSKTFTTKAGSKLPIMSLKGKDYMQVAQRLVWFVEENPNYTINSEFITISTDETVARVTISILDASGKVIKSSMATKRENTKGFGDHTEKAETGAIGRALALLGYGTQFSEADLDEGNRLADSPVERPTVSASPNVAASPKATDTVASTPSTGGGFKRPAGFGKPVKKAEASGGTWS